ncbi:MAG: DNA helicase RecQ [Clostridia bacterium]|nr:DNA helicase RecQ [Clostridia bacterium]
MTAEYNHKRIKQTGNRMLNKYQILKEVFGHEQFRRGQEEIIDALADGRDVLAIMPTGGGKSVCYQIPALLSDGVTLVISPLISLMKDQVAALIGSGVRAAYINSSLTYNQYLKVLRNMRDGVYKIIYIAPERLQSEGFLACCSEINISLIAVDEAHCVSGWGQDFRPAYLGIADFVDSLPYRPVVGAFTATATERVKNDIAQLLRLDDPFTVTTGFDRPNLAFEVIPTTKGSKSTELLKLMRERYQGQCGIVYCCTRSLVEEVSRLLSENGYSASAYHAGMTDEARHTAQDDFIYDRCEVMVATNAFGMGIDKSNVSFVIHYNMPKDIESYYQEAGRAGRDGKEAECVLLASESDIVLNRFLIEKTEPLPGVTPEVQQMLQRQEFDRLAKMTDYCRTMGCLRAFLLRYFGEEVESDNCGNCSNCTGEFNVRDITTDAQKVLSCIARTNNTYGATTIAAVLRASMTEQIEKHNLDALSVYGIMRGATEKYIRQIIGELRMQGYLTVEESTVYRIPSLTPKAREILTGGVHVFMKEPMTAEQAVKKPKKKVSGEVTSGGGLLEQLKAERGRIARNLGVPAYIVFTDATLYDMCAVMPKNMDEFLTVSGVGKVKAEKYGESFLAIIRSFKPM